MLSLVLSKQKDKRSILVLLIYFIIFLSIYLVLDHLNGGYQLMNALYGPFLPIINIGINLIMSFISALMMSFSTIYLRISGKEGKGSFMSFVSLIFGLLTYGCTPCVIAFFASLGITFTVAALPFSGLPYKIITLFILMIGFIWLIYEIKHPRCKVKIGE